MVVPGEVVASHERSLVFSSRTLVFGTVAAQLCPFARVFRPLQTGARNESALQRGALQSSCSANQRAQQGYVTARCSTRYMIGYAIAACARANARLRRTRTQRGSAGSRETMLRKKDRRSLRSLGLDPVGHGKLDADAEELVCARGAVQRHVVGARRRDERESLLESHHDGSPCRKRAGRSLAQIVLLGVDVHAVVGDVHVDVAVRQIQGCERREATRASLGKIGAERDSSQVPAGPDPCLEFERVRA